MIIINNYKLIRSLFNRILLTLIVTVLICSLFISTSHASGHFSKDQLKVLDDINKLRAEMNLPLVQLNADLTNAAIDHSIYLFANDKIGHVQDNKLYDTHKYFNERIEQYAGKNYYKSQGWYMIAEDVDYRSPVYAVRDLVEAPYHRYPIIHPELTDIGVGTIGYHNTVITFGIAESKNYIQNPILYPYNGATNVLLSQKVYESPDPFDDTPMLQEEAGYILSIFTGEVVHSNSLNISLYDEHSNPIEFILKSLTPNEGSDFWLVIPIKQLKPLTTYTFKVNGSSSQFTTMSQNEFEKWDIYREDEYISYKSKKSHFDKLIAEINNSRFNTLPANSEALDNKINSPIKDSLPTKFEQRGYSRENIGIYLNDDYVTLNPTAKLRENRTYIPLRGLLESLNAEVIYSSITKEITIKQNDLIIKLTPNSKYVHITKGSLSITEKLDSTPFIEEGSTFVPLRFLSHALGAEVVWDQSSSTVGIAYYNTN